MTDPSAEVEVERKRFETHWGAPGLPVALFRRFGSGYIDPWMDGRWEGWLAAKRDADKGERHARLGG